MNKQNLLKIAKDIRKALIKYSPEILTGIGITGMITTTIMAVKATPKALYLIEKREDEELKVLTKIEKVKTCWKCYIPSVIVGSLSAACLVCATSTNSKRNAALATAYTLSESTLREYQNKVTEVIGDKKEQTIRDEIAKDKINNNPVSKNEVIITSADNILCYDVISGRYFKSDIEKIKKAANILSRRLLNDMYVSLNDFYDEIELMPTKIGEDLGWNVQDGLIELDFSSQLTDDGRPCLVINYKDAPRYDYQKLL